MNFLYKFGIGLALLLFILLVGSFIIGFSDFEVLILSLIPLSAASIFYLQGTSQSSDPRETDKGVEKSV